MGSSAGVIKTVSRFQWLVLALLVSVLATSFHEEMQSFPGLRYVQIVVGLEDPMVVESAFAETGRILGKRATNHCEDTAVLRFQCV